LADTIFDRPGHFVNRQLVDKSLLHCMNVDQMSVGEMFFGQKTWSL
jgi:hypothetical protein